ncbi:hypothetical protein A1353_00345 [Methylomonas methanica]|uniref:Uncharacterized protein n=1 Tax=Methylomonas methanica TaxID=421 RepID=A0A177MFL1_METMH|nr:hypothetical protein [Methylomonas methanica]OAI03589.1 hypothetical protein A1353_00345 [Methylomonas methanica]
MSGNANNLVHQYNKLGDVQIVASEVESRKVLDKVLSELSQLDDNRYGLWLLHRHHLLSDGQFLLEQPAIYNGQPALVASAIDELPNDAVPSRWALDPAGKWQPMEYSIDPAVRKATANPGLAEIMEVVAGALLKNDLSSLLGFCVLTRSDVLADELNGRLEITEGSNSIVTLISNAELKEESALPTTWCLSGNQVDSCRMRDWCYKSSSGHVRIPNHQSG